MLWRCNRFFGFEGLTDGFFALFCSAASCSVIGTWRELVAFEASWEQPAEGSSHRDA